MQHAHINSTGALPANAVTIEIKIVYGETKAYPACEKARIFADLAGTKTLTRASLHLVQQLGFEIISIANADWSNIR